MSNVPGRRGGGDGRRATGRVPRVHTTRPVRTGLRSGTSSRPGRRRPNRRPERRPATPAAARRRPLFTGRAVVLVGLVLLLALTLAGPIRQYLAGQAELARLVAEGEALDQRAAELETELDRQADPAYAERQARERLSYVLPGDRLVIVVDGEAVEGDAGTLAAAAEEPEPVSWYETLLRSVADADAAGGPDRPGTEGAAQ
ncbi:septum formation initiator family protein [Blastococcus saxobsidens]|uniref:Septum formation initiator n=1 Tax=Blastococcus saxobsidens (strain DD2) TaxID=1146883 RepID=H6RSI8_BLASD|nr:septum formation initiator family protein [Blastococcus saxobsidens]CCG01739.1 Septum formation initiator [Blastococcus saxobsidens DD2]